MRKWTIMVYMAADSTLANFAIESLKLLRDAATEEVVVAAQLDPDGLSSLHNVRRYIFDGKNRNQLLKDEKAFWKLTENRHLDMTEPSTLADFMGWAFADYPAENYCLILWGHGPELLLELPDSSRQKRGYFTPVRLKQAIQLAKSHHPAKAAKLKIIGMDACSMSICEFAYELQGLADFMIASQEEVPDLSFPYRNLVERFCCLPTPEEVCRQCIEDYLKAYQQYFYDKETDMYPVTLAAIRLTEMKVGKGTQTTPPGIAALTAPLKALTTAFRSGRPEVDQAIYEARTKAKGYTGGLFVDLCDFCAQVQGPPDLKVLCDKVSQAVKEVVVAGFGVVNGQIAGLETRGLRSHGLSIYFPYLSDDETEEYGQETPVKGTPRVIDKNSAMESSQGTPVKGTPRVIDKNSAMVAGSPQLDMLARQVRFVLRQELIKDTEEYYGEKGFDFAENTGWYQFIQQGWSRILTQYEPNGLDVRYMALQIAKNLFGLLDAKPDSGNGRDGGDGYPVMPPPPDDQPSPGSYAND